MTSSYDIAREFVQAAEGDLRSAIYRMAHVINMARARVEDAAAREAMDGEQLRLLWRDLHPNERRAEVTVP